MDMRKVALPSACEPGSREWSDNDLYAALVRCSEAIADAKELPLRVSNVRAQYLAGKGRSDTSLRLLEQLDGAGLLSLRPDPEVGSFWLLDWPDSQCRPE